MATLHKVRERECVFNKIAESLDAAANSINESARAVALLFGASHVAVHPLQVLVNLSRRVAVVHLVGLFLRRLCISRAQRLTVLLVIVYLLLLLSLLLFLWRELKRREQRFALRRKGYKGGCCATEACPVKGAARLRSAAVGVGAFDEFATEGAHEIREGDFGCVVFGNISCHLEGDIGESVQ